MYCKNFTMHSLIYPLNSLMRQIFLLVSNFTDKEIEAKKVYITCYTADHF